MPLDLLDRLLQEEQCRLQATETTTTPLDVPDFFHTDLLNLVLNHWRKMVFEHVTLRQEQDCHPEQVIHRLMNYHNVKTRLRPNTQTFSMVVDACASFDQAAAEIAHNLVVWSIEEAFNCPWIQPNVYTFSSLMNAWVKSKHPEAPEKVERLLEEMYHLHLEHGWDVAPNQVTYATAIDAWAKLGRVDRAELLLHDMHAAYNEVGLEQLRPNLPAFNGLLVALARAGEMDRAEQLLEQMEDLYESGELDQPPSVISYSTLLDAFAKSKEQGSAKRAEAILRQMKDRGVDANVISWNSVIDAYTKEKNPERAELLLREMNQEHLQGNHQVKPTMRTYSVVLSGWSDKQSHQSGDRAEQLLDLMKNLADSGELEPLDLVVYNSVLACWAKSSVKGAAMRAKKFLEKRMIEMDGMIPDTYSYNTVMSALVREGRIVDAEAMIDSMREVGVNPDVTAYNTIIYAWIKSGAKDAIQRVKNVHNRMKEDKNVEADLITMNTLLHFYSKSGNPEAAENLLNEMCASDSKVAPDSISFNTTVAAWTASHAPDAPERADAILQKMIDYGKNVKPNVRTFNGLLNAWVKHRPNKALPECKRLIGMMFDMAAEGNARVQPDGYTYNILIHAHGLSPDDDAQVQADIIFQEMYRRYKAGDDRLKPTGHTYGSLIHGWSRCSHPDAAPKAEEALRWWIERANKGEVDSRPKVYSFVAAMNAHTKSGHPDAVYKVDGLLHLLLEECQNGNKEAQPNSGVFSAVLRALVSSPLPQKIKPARKIIDLMKQYNIRPDHVKIELLKECCKGLSTA